MVASVSCAWISALAARLETVEKRQRAVWCVSSGRVSPIHVLQLNEAVRSLHIANASLGVALPLFA